MPNPAQPLITTSRHTVDDMDISKGKNHVNLSQFITAPTLAAWLRSPTRFLLGALVVAGGIFMLLASLDLVQAITTWSQVSLGWAVDETGAVLMAILIFFGLVAGWLLGQLSAAPVTAPQQARPVEPPQQGDSARSQLAAVHGRVDAAAGGRVTLHALTNVVLRVGQDGICREMMAGSDLTHDLHEADLAGKPLTTIFPALLAERALSAIGIALRREQVRVEEMQLVMDNSTIDVEVRVIADEPDEALLIIRDISNQKAAEQQQHLLTTERERSGLLRQFMAALSTEFRTPLSTINTGAYLLQRTTNPEKQHQHVASIVEQVEVLEELVEHLYMMSKFDAETDQERQFIEINDVLTTALDHVRPLATAKQLQVRRLHAADTPSIRGNREGLVRAFRNILTLIVQHAPRASLIEVDVSRTGAFLTITLAFMGDDISEAVNNVIGRYASEGDLYEANIGRSLLGLTISRKQIEAHSGTLEIEPDPDMGSIIRVQIPIIMN